MATLKALPLAYLRDATFFKLASAAHYAVVPSDDGKNAMSSAKFMESVVARQSADLTAMTWEVYFAANAAAFGAVVVVQAIPGVNVIVDAAWLLNLFTGGAAPLFFINNVALTIIVANGLNGALRQVGDPLLVHGNQTGYPAIVDPEGIQPPIRPNIIDGMQTLKLDPQPPITTYGVGYYRFEKDLSIGMGVYGTSGALAFTSDDPSTHDPNTKKPITMAVAWHLTDTFQPGKGGFAVTSDLEKHYGTLQNFFDKTAGANSTSERQDYSSQWRIDSMVTLRDYDSASLAKQDQDEYVLTLRVLPG